MAETTTKRHPIRAAIYGLILGLGISVLLTLVYPVIALESVRSVITQVVIVVVIVMVISALWGSFGPAKAPKGSPPASAMPADAAPEQEGPAGAGGM